MGHPWWGIAGALAIELVRNLVNLHHIRELTVHHEVRIYWATVVGVTCINLLAGVGLGVAVSVFYAIRRLSSVKVAKRQEGDVWKVSIRGTLTFACVPQLNLELSALPAGAAVDVDLDVDYIDHAAFESLHSWRLNHEKTGGKVRIEEVQAEWYKPAAEGRPRCGREA